MSVVAYTNTAEYPTDHCFSDASWTLKTGIFPRKSSSDFFFFFTILSTTYDYFLEEVASVPFFPSIPSTIYDYFH